MKEITLSQGQVALIDDEDYDWLNQWKWSAIKVTKNNTFYAVRASAKKTIYMHRFILGLTDSNIQGDHIDHNGLHNYRSNLRIATKSQNAANVSVRKNATSLFLGVSRYNKNDWRADIRKDGVQQRLGYFKNETDAAIAYNEAAIKLHGEFANTNTIQ